MVKFSFVFIFQSLAGFLKNFAIIFVLFGGDGGGEYNVVALGIGSWVLVLLWHLVTMFCVCVCVHNIFRSTQSAKRLIIPLSNTISDIAYIVNKVLDEQHDHDDDVENERPKKKT